MPLSGYDSLFGKRGGAAEAHDAMVKQYGPKKGNAVFYGLIAKRRKKLGGSHLARALQKKN